MSARTVAATIALSLAVSACGPLVICNSDEPCARESHDEDHGDAILVGTTLAVLLFTVLAVSKAHSNDDEKPKAPPPIAPRAADPSTMVFAPLPRDVSDEGEQLRLQRMYVQGQVLARAGRCDGAMALARQIARSSPDYLAVYMAEPAIAGCIRTSPPR